MDSQSTSEGWFERLKLLDKEFIQDIAISGLLRVGRFFTRRHYAEPTFNLNSSQTANNVPDDHLYDMEYINPPQHKWIGEGEING